MFANEVLRGLSDLGVRESGHGRHLRPLVTEGHLTAGRLHQLVRQRRLLRDERVEARLPGGEEESP